MVSVYLADAQGTTLPIGARAMGAGQAAACLSDEWALFNNVAGLAKVNHFGAGFTVEAHPSFPSFNRMAAVLIMPLKPAVLAAGVYRFGDDLYNEQVLSAGIANTLGIASLGMKINYVQYHAEGFGNTTALTISIGGIAQLTPGISVGAHILNINQPEISSLNDERVPTVLTLGLGIKPSEKLFICPEVEKDLEHPLTWKTGLEYFLNKKVVLRTGYTLYPQAGFAGIGCISKKFNLDYAFQYNAALGACHQASVRYYFRIKK